MSDKEKRISMIISYLRTKNLTINKDDLTDDNVLSTIISCIEEFESLNDSNSIKYGRGYKEGLVSINSEITENDFWNWIFTFIGNGSKKSLLFKFAKSSLITLKSHIKILKNQERCVFAIVVALTDNNPQKIISKENIIECFEVVEESMIFCPFEYLFYCEQRNKENCKYCGKYKNSFDSDLDSVLKSLDDKKIIKYDEQHNVITVIR